MIMEESNAELDKCMKDWEDLSAEYLVINAIIFHKWVIGRIKLIDINST